MIEKKYHNKEKEQVEGLFPKADLDELEKVYLDIADQVRKLESHLIFNFCDKTPKLREYLVEQLRLMTVVGHYEFALGFKAGARMMSELLGE